MRGYVCMLMAAWAAAAGCSRQPFDTPSRRERGLVVVLPGIEGRSPINAAIVRGLNSGGVNCAIRVEDWTRRVPGLVNLWSETRNRLKAEEIAQSIVRYQMAYPGRPVVLVGQSGGGALAVWTAEAMPPESRVDGVILLAAALSPGYPLPMALANTRRGIVNFHSRLDWVFLDAGTKLYGTMDGRHTVAAGRVGFDVPTSPGRSPAYSRLFQVPWTKTMALTGHVGGHLTSGAEQFVSRYVAALVMARRWDAAVVGAAADGTLAPGGALAPGG